MKRIVLLIFLLTLLVSLAGCAGHYRTDITREEVVAAYEAAGYNVWTDIYDEKLDYGQIAYVQANHPDGNYIYFSFFENTEDAKAYKKVLDHPVMKGIFSIIFGNPSWERMETYGCIVVSYDNPDLFDPFVGLLSGK